MHFCWFSAFLPRIWMFRIIYQEHTVWKLLKKSQFTVDRFFFFVKTQMRHFWAIFSIFFSHLIFLLLFWYNIVIAVIFICIVEMMCDKCDNFFFFAFLSHTKIQSCFLIFFFEVFFFELQDEIPVATAEFWPSSIIYHCQ